MNLPFEPVRASRVQGLQGPYGGSQLVLTLYRICYFCFQMCNRLPELMKNGDAGIFPVYYSLNPSRPLTPDEFTLEMRVDVEGLGKLSFSSLSRRCNVMHRRDGYPRSVRGRMNPEYRELRRQRRQKKLFIFKPVRMVSYAQAPSRSAF